MKSGAETSVQWTPTDSELREILRSPEAVQAAIDWNEVQAVEMDAMGYPTPYHDARIKELEAIRDRLKAERCRGMTCEFA